MVRVLPFVVQDRYEEVVLPKVWKRGEQRLLRVRKRMQGVG